MIMPFTPTPATTIPIVTAEAPVTTAVPDAARVAEPLAAVPTEKEPPPPRKPAIEVINEVRVVNLPTSAYLSSNHAFPV